MISFRLANNLEECAEAFSLAKEIFAQNTADPDYKTILWELNGITHPKQLMLAFDHSKVIGLARMIPTQIAWRDHSYSLMGLSSICIDPSYQDNNVGRGLMEATVNHCDAIDVNASYLVARHAVDYFYTKFGFIGASSYPQLTILQLESEETTDILFEAYNPNHVSNYIDFHHHAYSESLRLARNESDYWEKAFYRLPYLGLSFLEIWKQNELIGYVLSGEDYIDEIAFADSTSDRNIIASLNKLQNKFSKNLILHVPHQHQIVTSLTGCDVLFISRQCRYGGHMLRWNKLHPSSILPINIGIPQTPEEKNYPVFALSKLDEI